jgi:hypothetical protein
MAKSMSSAVMSWKRIFLGKNWGGLSRSCFRWRRVPKTSGVGDGSDSEGYQANEPVDKLAVNSVHWWLATGTLALRRVIHGSKDLTKRTSDSAISV